MNACAWYGTRQYSSSCSCTHYQFDCHHFIWIIRDSFRHVFTRWLFFFHWHCPCVHLATLPSVSFYRRLIYYFTLVRLVDGRCRLCFAIFAYNSTLFYFIATLWPFRMSVINNPKMKACHMTNTLIKN